MKKFLAFIFSIIIFGGFSEMSFAIQEDNDEHQLFHPIEIQDGTIISITNAVAAAYKNSPLIKRQKYNLDIAKSNVGIARSQYFPVISAGVGFYNENNSDNIYYSSHYRDFPSVGVSINQLIYNFGKTTSYIKMEEFYKIGAEYEFMDSLCSALFNVKDKYYKVLKAKALVEICENDIFLNEHIIKISKNKAAISMAKVNLQKAKINLIEAQNAYNNAKIDLTNAMYLDDNPNYILKNTNTFSINNDFDYNKDTIEIPDFTPLSYDFDTKDAVNIAYENSPDLKVLISTKKAMEESLKYIKKTYLPDLRGTVGYGFNKNLDTSNNSLALGVNLTSDVNIKELQHSIKGASAQLKQADNDIDLFKKDVLYEVKRALNNIDTCIKQISTAKDETQQAYITLKIVEQNYKNGIDSYSTLQRARKDFIEAQKIYVASVADYNTSLIQLEMAMHVHIFDIHHKSEHAMHYHSSELLEHLNKVLGCDEDEEHSHKNHKKTKHIKDDRL